MTPTEDGVFEAAHREIAAQSHGVECLYTCTQAAAWGIAYGIKQATGLASAEYARGLKEGIAYERKRAAGVARKHLCGKSDDYCTDDIAAEIEAGEP